MTYEELLDLIDKFDAAGMVNEPAVKALRAVVRLHQPNQYGHCLGCPTHGDVGCYLDNDWKYCPTIQVIHKALNNV